MIIPRAWLLARLEHDGLVTIERYRGARVRMVSEDEAMEIFETREAICEGSADRASAAMMRYHRDALASLQQAMALRGVDDDVA